MSESGGAKRAAVFLIIVLVVGAGVAFLVAGARIKLAWLSRPFSDAKIRELAAVEYPAGEGTVKENQKLYRVGKVLVVRRHVIKFDLNHSLDFGSPEANKEVEPARIDPDWARLDGSVRADSQDEIGTLVLCKRTTVKLGTYVKLGEKDQPPLGDYGWAMQHSAELTLYDVKKKCAIGRVTIQGPAPPPVKSSSVHDPGTPADVAAFVNGLAVR